MLVLLVLLSIGSLGYQTSNSSDQACEKRRTTELSYVFITLLTPRPFKLVECAGGVENPNEQLTAAE